MTQLQDLLIDPLTYWPTELDPQRPLGFVDLANCPYDLRVGTLPPFPVIGIGDLGHPLAMQFDAVVEPPISVDTLIRQVSRNPNAASVLVQLLRGTQGQPAERTLFVESIAYGLLQGSAEHRAWLSCHTAPAPSDSPGGLLVGRDGPVLHMTIDRSAANNAIDRALRDELYNAFTIASLDTDVTGIRLRARGRVFSIGGDLAEFGISRDPAIAHLIRSRSLPAYPLSHRAEILDVQVQGPCVGAGLELAAFAARLTATADAWFQLPELSMGLIPGAGGCFSVPQRIGRQRATLMMLSGRRINAITALKWGLIDSIEPVAS